MSLKMYDMDETIIRESILGQRRLYYNTYVFKCDDLKQWEKVLKGYRSIITNNPMLRYTYDLNDNGDLVGKDSEDIWDTLQIRQIDEITDSIREKMFYGAVNRSRRMSYDPRVNYLMNMTVFMAGMRECYFVLSICEFLLEVFEPSEISMTLGINIEMDSKIPSGERYIGNYYAKLASSGSPRIKNQCYNADRMRVEEYELDRDIVSLLHLNEHEGNPRYRYLSIAVCSLLLGRSYNKPTVVSGSLRDKKYMAPLSIGAFSCQTDLQHIYANAEVAFADSDKQMACRLAAIEEAFGDYIYSKVDIIHDFSQFDNIKLSKLESIPKRGVALGQIAAAKAPINIIYRRKSNSIFMEYEYDKSIYTDINIKQCHELYTQIIKAAISQSVTNMETKEIQNAVVMDKVKVKTRDERFHDYKYSHLMTNPLFTCLSNEDMEMVIRNTTLRISDMGDNIILPGCASEYIGLIVDGKIAVERLDGDNCIKPLYILKEGNVFGLETFTEKGTVNDIYSVASDAVAVLYVPAKCMKNIAQRNSKVMQVVLDSYAKRLDQFKKLWLLG